LAVHLDDSGGVVHDNCVELLTNDIGVAPRVRNYAWNNDQDNSNSNQSSANYDLIDKFQTSIGGSQGERMGFSTFSAQDSPFVKVAKEDLLRVLDAIVSVQQEWGTDKTDIGQE
jgi:sulfite reductase beta subunit-like hemoprotein